MLAVQERIGDQLPGMEQAAAKRLQCEAVNKASPTACCSTYTATLMNIRARVAGGSEPNMAPSYSRLDPPLHENQIEPAVELVAHLTQAPAP